ncbi:MAG: hypothetical protein J0H96_11915 [Microbacterium ginsengisoli]|jgi:hypothetical protein|nr:hypothetical protein [Microbacterium ginsengisoli]
MTISKPDLIVPGHGTLFIAELDAALPADPLNAFSLKGAAPAGWENIGHTSKDNTAAFKRDGGDATSLDTWLEDNVDTIYAATKWSLGINPLQVDKTNLDLGFNGWIDTDGGYVIPATQDGLDKQLFLLATDGTGKLAFYMPSTTVSIGDAPSIDTTKFFEIPLSASILAAPEEVIAARDGKAGLMKVYKTGLSALAPTITSLAPSTAAAGAQVTIVTQNSGVITAVKFGNTTTSFVQVGDTIIAVVPAGAAGTANVTAANAAGTSAAAPFTRS